MLKFAIIGAGAGGQSMAAILTSKGYIAKLYDIDKEKIHRLQELKTIKDHRRHCLRGRTGGYYGPDR